MENRGKKKQNYFYYRNYDGNFKFVAVATFFVIKFLLSLLWKINKIFIEFFQQFFILIDFYLNLTVND